MYFSDTPSQKEFEKLMQGVPNFAPRGHGSFISKAQPALCERSQPPPASLSDAMERTLSRVNCPPFQKRLKQYLKEREKTPMDYRNEKHRIAFAETIEKLNQKDYALMSAVYLLTAEYALWMKAKCKVEKNGILFDTIKLQNSTENAYTLFCCAKDLYLGTKHITIKGLADTELISPKMFGLICNAMAIRRFGLNAINFTFERKHTECS